MIIYLMAEKYLLIWELFSLLGTIGFKRTPIIFPQAIFCKMGTAKDLFAQANAMSVLSVGTWKEDKKSYSKSIKGGDIMINLTKIHDFYYYFPYILKQHNQLLYIGEIDSNDKILISNGVNAYKHKVYLSKKGLYFMYKGKRFYITLYDDSKRLINFIGEPSN